ncbi:opine metallophore biosynthesis dehydrogenase [Paraburkholderia edwinii]|uniref:opine metallophore biosynthesis dehydrogenase n=1 Tax=Paraburkholderia edwinii TaxID=2861782 RepID=UPI003CCE5725
MDAQGQWHVPRVPLEDHRKLSLVSHLGRQFQLDMPQTQDLLSNFAFAIERFVNLKGAQHCHPTVLRDNTQELASIIYRQWSTRHGRAVSC